MPYGMMGHKELAHWHLDKMADILQENILVFWKACMTSSHYLDQCWFITDWTLNSLTPGRFEWNFRSLILLWNSVLSKVQNRGSPNGPPMVDGWVVRIAFGWSVYVVVRNDNKTLIMTSMPFVFHDHQGLYPKISLSLGRTRFLFKVLQSFWNLIGGPLLVVPSCLSNFKAIGNFQTTHSC